MCAIRCFNLCAILFTSSLLQFSSHHDTWKLIIDQDAGADDAMAMFMAFINEKCFEGPEVVAITVSHGNVNETQAFHNTQRILSIAKRRDVPIYRGAAHSLIFEPPSDQYFGVDGLGDTEYMSHFSPIAAQHECAAEGMIQLSKEYEGRLVIVTLGALTNVALAARLDPGFISRVKQIYVAAGYIQTREEFKKVEYNVLADIEAYKVLMEVAEPSKVTLIASTPVHQYLELSWKFRLDVLGKLDTNIMRVQNEFDRVAFGENKALRGHREFYYLDPAAMAAVLNQNIVRETRYSKCDVVLCGSFRGYTSTDFVDEAEANVNVFTSYDRESYRKFLLKIFSLDL